MNIYIYIKKKLHVKNRSIIFTSWLATIHGSLVFPFLPVEKNSQDTAWIQNKAQNTGRDQHVTAVILNDC